MMKKMLLGVLALLLPLPAWALCVGCSCTASATGVSFGDYNPFGPNVNSTGNVRVSCRSLVTLGTINYSIALSAGHSGTYAPRHMDNAGNPLNYNLYTADSYAQVWGDGSGGTGVVTGSITLFVLIDYDYEDHTVYGRVPGNQTSTVVGDYADTITVTVTYD